MITKLTFKLKRELALILFEQYGVEDCEDFLEQYGLDGAVPGICYKCKEYSTGVEPDSMGGYCEECGTNTVVSGLILLGII